MALDNSNRFLASLSGPSCEHLLHHAVPMDLPLRMPLYEAEERPQFAYLLASGLASVVTTTTEGDSAEIGIIGREGLVGAQHIIGPAMISSHCFVQMEGAGWRIPLSELRRAFLHRDDVRDRILEFVQEQALVVGQSAGCNRLHEAEARLARWLLMAQDRTGSETLNLTQEFLGMMLGSRRTTVSLIAGTLQRLGYIEFSRGRVVILDREKLQDVACDCYPIMRDLHQELYSRPASAW